MTPAQRESFLNTRYELQLPSGTAHLIVDRHNVPLDAWLRANRYTCAAWLTAFNPGSVLCADELNEAAQARLESRLSGDYVLLHGTAIDPGGGWPPEPSVLVAGMSPADAMTLAREFGQVAFLWCGTDAVPRLMAADQVPR